MAPGPITNSGGQIRLLDGSTSNFTYTGGGNNDCERPATISADYTVEGACKVDGTTVTGGATLTLEPGATLKFRPNKRLIVEDGAGILAEGTSGSTIRFKRNNSSEPWDGVEVRGQGQPRVFEHVVFEGGETALRTKADGVEVDHATFRDNTGNAIEVGPAPGGQTCTLTLSSSTLTQDVIVEDGAALDGGDTLA